MKYRIASIDSLPGGQLYVVVNFTTDARGQVQREDFVIGRPAVERRYIGPPLADDGNELPDPADYADFPFDVAAAIVEVIERYYHDHPELDDARLRDDRWRADRTDQRLAQRKTRDDPLGHLARADVQALVEAERTPPPRPPGGRR